MFCHLVSTSHSLCSNLHWLPIHKRINFKVTTLTYKVLSTQQPAYLHGLISYHQPSRSLRSSSQSLLHVPRLDVVLSPLLLPKSGTVYPLPLKSHRHLTPSNVTSKPTILLSIIFSPPSNFLTLVRYQNITLHYITNSVC